MVLALALLACGDDKDAVTGATEDPPVEDGDRDDDGHEPPADCDDDDATVHPGAVEVPYDGIDNDCADGDLADVDQDGHEPPEDCDDDDATVHPNAADTVGNGADDDCDGVDGRDGDADGVASTQSGGTDCDDADPERFPGATETWYDAIDQDCDGICDFDQDGDGAVLAGAPVAPGTPCAGAAEDCDDADPDASTAHVTSTFPTDGSTLAGVGTIVRVNLNEPDPTASLALYDAGLVAVPGTSTTIGTQVQFVPDAPLAEGAAYTAEATYSCGLESFSFTTLGPLDPSILVGRVWEADITDGNWVAPAGIGALVGLVLSASVLLSVTGEAGTTLDLRGAPGFGAGQDLCLETVELPGTPFDANPALLIGPADLAADAGGATITLRSATISGVFAADGSEILEAAVSGEIDTREVDPLIGLPGGTCGLIVAFGINCAACSDGSGNYCLWVEVEDVPALELPGATLVERTAADIAADPACP